MRKKEKLTSHLPIALCPPAIVYPLLFVFALIFAQSHRSALSHVLFIFTACLPIASALYLLAARIFIRAELRASRKAVKKQGYTNITADIRTKLPIPFPFVEAVMILPDESGITLEESRFITAILPFHACSVARPTLFALCGEYEICLSHLYVYDLTRSVRIRINVNKRESIFVLPRSITLPKSTASSYDGSVSLTDKSPVPSVQGEPTDVREYTRGDSLRRIHWKLSSKSEELFIREFFDSTSTVSFIFCDLEAKIKGGDPEADAVANLISSNAVLECASAVMLRELDAGNSVCLSYVSGGSPISLCIENRSEIGGIYRRFLSENPSDTPEQIKLLLGCVTIPKSSAVTVITSNFSDTDTKVLAPTLMQIAENNASELLVCTPKDAPKNNVCAQTSVPGVAVHQILV